MNRWDVVGQVIEEHGLTFGAELGVLKGTMFFHLLDRFPALHMLAVDIWEPQPKKDRRRAEGGRSYGHFDFAELERNFRAKAWRYGDRAIVMKTTTLEAAEAVNDGSLDFVYIDADHLYEAVKADIAAWRPKIRPGGVLMGHDYNLKMFPGVVKAVNELETPVKLLPSTVWMTIL